MFEDSVLIVAHPDDDILWLGSIIDKVDSIIFCFNDDPGNPALIQARTETIKEYPLKNVISLDLTETQSWDKANWNMPHESGYGLKLERSPSSEALYAATYAELVGLLRSRIHNKKNVFTHNPWGEYGHEEHVLVYRVLRNLQKDYQYTLWYSNYCSNRSLNLMNRYISGFDANYKCLPVNLELVNIIAKIYKKNRCWTWYEDYQWFEQECLMQAGSWSESSAVQSHYGRHFPINYIKIDFGQQVKKEPSCLAKIKATIKRKIGY